MSHFLITISSLSFPFCRFVKIFSVSSCHALTPKRIEKRFARLHRNKINYSSVSFDELSVVPCRILYFSNLSLSTSSLAGIDSPLDLFAARQQMRRDAAVCLPIARLPRLTEHRYSWQQAEQKAPRRNPRSPE